MSKITVLLDVNDTSLLKALQPALSGPDKHTIYSSEFGEGLTLLKKQPADIALIETNQFSAADLALLKEIYSDTQTQIMLFSDGQPNVNLDKAIYYGVTYHFRTPYDLEHIATTVTELIAELSEHNKQSVESKKSALDQFGLLLGSSDSMRELFKTIRKIAVTDANVFLNGESGTGKELVANTIHLVSERSEQPFIAVNCGALSPDLVESELFGHVKGSFTGANRDHKGVFEQANGGTLFLDEITEMPLEHQVKLLRVLENGEYKPVGSDKTFTCNVRVIAASNRDMAEAADEFIREDLYYRLAQFPIQLPPLRDRGADITGLAQHFLAYRNAEFGTAKSLSEQTLTVLETHSWPGNVRELKHVIERSYILAELVIEPEHILFDELNSIDVEADSKSVPMDMTLEAIEKIAIERNLEKNKGNKSETADKLGISVKTLYNKLEKYNDLS